MKARYSQDGKSVDYRPADAVSAGDVVVQETLVGVARLDIPADTLGSLAVVGIFEVEKAADAVAAGTPVYWDATNKVVTTTATGNVYFGKTVYAAEASDATAYVLLNAPYVATA